MLPLLLVVPAPGIVAEPTVTVSDLLAPKPVTGTVTKVPTGPDDALSAPSHGVTVNPTGAVAVPLPLLMARR